MAVPVKAQLIELKSDLKTKKDDGKSVTVQFNPETLKVNFANQIVPPGGGGGGGGDQNGGASQLFVGRGTTKMSCQLTFDVNAEMPDGAARKQDVRELTKDVIYFITPQSEPKNAPRAQQHQIPPGVRFLWGSFQFDGIVESLEESLEFFSPEGRPLRATVSLGLTNQEILEVKFGGNAAQASPNAPSTPGDRPVAQAPQNGTVQGMAAQAGRRDWQNVAAANGIENPRVLPPGTPVDLGAGLGPNIGSALGAAAAALARR